MADNIDFKVTVIKEEIEIEDHDLYQLNWIHVVFPELGQDDNLTLKAESTSQKQDTAFLSLNNETSKGNASETEDDLVIHEKIKRLKVVKTESGTKLQRSGRGRLVPIGEKDRPFKCNICGNRFTQKANMRTHALTHMKVKPYKCNLCDYRCSQSGNLKSHVMRIHTEEDDPSKIKIAHTNLVDRAHKCNICEYRFLNEKALEKHINKIHLKIKAKIYECIFCENKFSSKSSLKLHTRTHTKDKPYKCNLCDYRCSQKGNMKSHTMRIHMQSVYEELKVISS